MYHGYVFNLDGYQSRMGRGNPNVVIQSMISCRQRFRKDPPTLTECVPCPFVSWYLFFEFQIFVLYVPVYFLPPHPWQCQLLLFYKEKLHGISKKGRWAYYMHMPKLAGRLLLGIMLHFCSEIEGIKSRLNFVTLQPLKYRSGGRNDLEVFGPARDVLFLRFIRKGVLAGNCNMHSPTSRGFPTVTNGMPFSPMVIF